VADVVVGDNQKIDLSRRLMREEVGQDDCRRAAAGEVGLELVEEVDFLSALFESPHGY
jgi:hypothetical protein